MNKPMRKVAIAIAVLFLALFVNLNVVQVLQGSSYRDNSHNQRVLLNEYASPRGQINVGGSAVAESLPSSGDLKYLRRYPQGPIYATATGYYSVVFGKAGVENAANSVLSGDDPALFGTRLADILTGRNPKGGSVQLTLNARAQAAAYKAMGNRRGAVVALDPKTGAILALLSTPSYDPNTLASHDTAQITKYNAQLSKDPDQPLLNRTGRQVYPAGSIFKIIDSAALLANNSALTPNTTVPAPNSYWPLNPSYKGACPSNGEGACVQNFDRERCGSNGTTASLSLALAKSCNTTFAKLAAETLKGDKIAAMAKKFGFDTPYSGDQAGDLCDPFAFTTPLGVCRSTPGSQSDLSQPDSLAQTAIGQRDVGITPVQAAMLSSAVANNGTLMKPYLVAKELRPDLSVLRSTEPSQLDQVLEPQRDADLIQLMRRVVEDPQGTGGPAAIDDIDGVVVGGKTGTADHGSRDPKTGKFPPPHAWFTGFALAKGDPKIAVSVIIEDGGVTGNETTGGKAAAPVAKAVMEAYLRSIGVGS